MNYVWSVPCSMGSTRRWTDGDGPISHDASFSIGRAKCGRGARNVRLLVTLPESCVRTGTAGCVVEKF